MLAFLSQLMSWGLMFSLTYFIGPMTSDLGWSATEFSFVNFLSNVSFAVIMPFLGRYIDQYGGRGFMITGGLLGGLGIGLLAFVQQVWQFYAIMGVFVPFAMSLYGVMVMGVALANWYHRKRGRAFAIASMGTSAGGVTFGPLASYLIGVVGWRETWLILACIVTIGITVPSFLFMRRRPEDVGLRPDGDAIALDSAGEPIAAGPAPGEYVWTRSTAMRTPAFWSIALCFAMSNLVIGAFLLHIIPFLKVNGLNAAQATALATVFSATLVLCKPIYGVMLERLAPRKMAFTSFCVSAVAIAWMLLFRQPAFLVVGVLLYALSMGGAIPMEDVTWANYFGRWTIGQIRSVAYPIESFLGALGPIIGGLVFDATGGYTGAFVIFAGAYVLAAIGILFARPPQPRTGGILPEPIPVSPVAVTVATPSRTGGAWRRALESSRRLADRRETRRYGPALSAGVAGFLLGFLVNTLASPGRSAQRRGRGGTDDERKP